MSSGSSSRRPNCENCTTSAPVSRSRLIAVERSWDPVEGVIEPKSRAGRRTVPITAALRSHLREHLLRLGRRDGLAFGYTAETPFYPKSLRRRAAEAWAETGLDPIGLHEARHSCASMMIAAGVNAKALSVYMGHANIATTLDRYAHLMPGAEGEAAALLDKYLEGRHDAREAS